MKIYFSGIGGVGLGPLAEIALDAGYEVLGSDSNESLTTNELKKRKVLLNIGQDGSFLAAQNAVSKIDWFVYTSALKEDHPELLLAKKLGIKTTKRDALLAKIIKDKNQKLIAVAGTHGKTTTTSMTVWTLKQLGIPVSYSIGTTISFGQSGSFDKDSEYFIYECDEFDRNFLNFEPFISIIPSIDYDHPDTYPTKEDYNQAFVDFAKKSQHVITWDNESAQIFNGLKNVEKINVSDINNKIKLAGIHNRMNATLVQKALEKINIKDTTEIISTFPGTDRRFEKIANNLYSDYGHHPVEIAATLQMARELSDNVVLVYQPHQNIRQHAIFKDYKDQFELAEKIYWLPTYLSREDPNLKILEPKDLIQNITNKESITISEFDDVLLQNIKNEIEGGKLVLISGAGFIDEFIRKNKAKLEA